MKENNDSVDFITSTDNCHQVVTWLWLKLNLHVSRMTGVQCVHCCKITSFMLKVQPLFIREFITLNNLLML